MGGSIGNLPLKEQSPNAVVNDAVDNKKSTSILPYAQSKGQLEEINEVSFDLGATMIQN